MYSPVLAQIILKYRLKVYLRAKMFVKNGQYLYANFQCHKPKVMLFQLMKI